MSNKHAFSIKYDGLAYSFVVDDDDEVLLIVDDASQEPNRELGPARNLDDAKRIANNALYAISREKNSE